MPKKIFIIFFAAIISAGVLARIWRTFCDMLTPPLAEYLKVFYHGLFLGRGALTAGCIATLEGIWIAVFIDGVFFVVCD